MQVSPRAFALIVLAGLAALGTSCSSVRTHYDFDPSADFSTWRTYAWYPAGPAPAGNPRLDNPLLHERIVVAVDRELAASGLTEVEGTTPDFYVRYHLSTERRMDVQTLNRSYVGGPSGRRWGGAGWSGVGWTETRVREYEVGTLVIDFVDVSQRRLVWRGSGTRRLSGDAPPHRLTQRVNEAVEEILAQFPPRG